MLKLLQINVTVNWGSTGRIAEQIGSAAISRGWDSYIAYGRDANDSNSNLIKIGSQYDVYNHYVENFLFDNEGLASRYATDKLIKRIQLLRPDVIHLHNIHDHYINYRKLFNFLNSVSLPVIWTFHDCWPITGHCMHFVTKNCDRWKSGCYDCLMKGEYPKTILDRSRRNWELKKNLFQNNKNLTIVACSNWLAQYVHESYLKDKHVEVIHNGCDINIFCPKPRIKYSKFRILAVSSIWHFNKGELDIYKLNDMLPEDEYEITVVGLNDEQLKNLPRNIKGFKRTQDVQELAQLYSDADVLINPTYEDNFPTVNIEALACGTPVITYRTGGSPEAVDENTGAVIEQGDIESLSDKIIEFKKLDFKEKHSKYCRARAEQCFDKDKCFEKYIDLYESILKL